MISLRRIVKQTTSALLGLGLLALVVVIIITPNLDLFRRPKTPPPPPRESIIIESVDVLTHNGTTDIVARVRNPNPRAGIPDYTLTFILLDGNGQQIISLSQSTYLLPGSLKYVAVLDVPITQAVGRVRVEQPADPVFTAFELESAIPSFSSFLRERTLQNAGSERFETHIGRITNAGNFGYRRVDIIGIAFDTNDRVIGVGKTFVGELQAGQQRDFAIQWPKPFADTAKVIILPDTNIYSEDNILPVSGDPGRLREQNTDTPDI